jgi:hypothetical protein
MAGNAAGAGVIFVGYALQQRQSRRLQPNTDIAARSAIFASPLVLGELRNLRLAPALTRRFGSVPIEGLQILQAAFVAAPESFILIHAGVPVA